MPGPRPRRRQRAAQGMAHPAVCSSAPCARSGSRARSSLRSACSPRCCWARSRPALAVRRRGRLPLAESRLAPLLVPASLRHRAHGFILLTTRRKAITQVLGYLVLENGIFIFGLLLVEAMPFLVEVGRAARPLRRHLRDGHHHPPHQPRVRLARHAPVVVAEGLSRLPSLADPAPACHGAGGRPSTPSRAWRPRLLAATAGAHFALTAFLARPTPARRRRQPAGCASTLPGGSCSAWSACSSSPAPSTRRLPALPCRARQPPLLRLPARRPRHDEPGRLRAAPGLMWVGIEATTLATAPLIYFNRTPRSLEATWKYLAHLLGRHRAGPARLVLPGLRGAAGRRPGARCCSTTCWRPRRSLSRPGCTPAFVLLLVGYGTKMGLAPMHTWKPDAYGEAPGVVGALLAGGAHQLRLPGRPAPQPDQHRGRRGRLCPRGCSWSMGLLSMAVAAVFMLGQRDFKRMLAYSSVEHMGILVPRPSASAACAMFGALLHLLNNGLTKGVLFLSAGNIHRAYGSKTTDEVHGALRRLPLSGALFLLGFFAHHRLAAVRPLRQRAADPACRPRRQPLGGRGQLPGASCCWSSSAWEPPCSPSCRGARPRARATELPRQLHRPSRRRPCCWPCCCCSASTCRRRCALSSRRRHRPRRGP